MATYRVRLTRTTTRVASVEVEADSPDQAASTAVDEAQKWVDSGGEDGIFAGPGMDWSELEDDQVDCEGEPDEA